MFVGGFFTYKATVKSKSIEADTNNRVQKAVNELDSKKLNVEAFEKAQEVMLKAMAQLEKQSDKDRALIEELESEIKALEEHVARLKEEIDALKTEVAELKAVLRRQGIEVE